MGKFITITLDDKKNFFSKTQSKISLRTSRVWALITSFTASATDWQSERIIASLAFHRFCSWIWAFFSCFTRSTWLLLPKRVLPWCAVVSERKEVQCLLQRNFSFLHSWKIKSSAPASNFLVTLCENLIFILPSLPKNCSNKN